VKELLRTILFGNASRDYLNRQKNPLTTISYPNIANAPTYVRPIDVSNINTPPVVVPAQPVTPIVRGSTGVLNRSVVTILDDHPEAPAFVVIDALPIAGILQRVQAGVPTQVKVGDAIPLVRIGNSNGLECVELRYAPTPSSSASDDSLICHAIDGGVSVSGVYKFNRSSGLTRISLKISEAAIPRFGASPARLTYVEQTVEPVLIGAALTFAVPATNFGNWRMVINGIANAALVKNGLDPHDVLSFVAGMVVRTGNALSVGGVLIGTVVDGYDGKGRPLAIDFTDMVGLANNLTAADVVLALAHQLEFSSTSRIMTQNGGADHSLHIGFESRTKNERSYIPLPLTWIGVPDAPTWEGDARVVLSRVQTVHGTLVCRDVDSGPGSPVDPSFVSFAVLGGANGLTFEDVVVTSESDGWKYVVPWTWTWSVDSGTAGATGGNFQVRASNTVGAGYADATIAIVVTGNADASLTFINDAPMALLATGTSGEWHVDLDQSLRVFDAQGVAMTPDAVQFTLGGNPPPRTAIDPQTGTLQIHFVETTAVPTAQYRFSVLVNALATTSTANGILPIVMMVAAVPAGSN